MLEENKIVRKHYFDLELDSFAVLVKMPNKTAKMRKSFLIVGRNNSSDCSRGSPCEVQRQLTECSKWSQIPQDWKIHRRVRPLSWRMLFVVTG